MIFNKWICENYPKISVVFYSLIRDSMKKLLLVASVIAATTCYAQSNTNQQTTKPEEKAVRQEDSANKPQLIISGAAEVHANFTSPDHT